MNKTSSSSGMVTEDPAVSLPIGSTIKFQDLLFTYVPPANVVEVEDWGSLNGILLSIGFTDVNFTYIEGSAFVVAPGVAVCATHVIEPRIDAIIRGAQAVYCYGIARDTIEIWKVLKLTMVPGADITILGLEMASDLQSDGVLHKGCITTRVPKLGEIVTMVGFRATSSRFDRGEENHFAGSIIVCSGVVTQHHLIRRDSFMLSWPVMEVSCPSWGGMSGGPVFDTSGQLVGLLSSSFSTEENDGPSYVSLLYPAMMTKFEGGWPPSLYSSESFTLLDIHPQMCTIDKRDAFVNEPTPEGRSNYTGYKVWYE